MKNSILTWIILLLNLGMYLYMMYALGLEFGEDPTPEDLIQVGGVTSDTPLYTWFTSMFLHSSVNHLALNMLSLTAMSSMVIYVYGRLSYLIGYFVSGIGASFAVANFTTYTVVVGASGAICGLFGMLVIGLLFRNKRERIDMSFVGINIILLSIITFAFSDVSIESHVGGFITGIIVGAIFSIVSSIFSYASERGRLE